MGRVTPTRVLTTLLLAGSGLVVLTSLAFGFAVMLTDHGNSSDLDWSDWEPFRYILGVPWLLIATALVGAVVLGVGEEVVRIGHGLMHSAGHSTGLLKRPVERDGKRDSGSQSVGRSHPPLETPNRTN